MMSLIVFSLFTTLISSAFGGQTFCESLVCESMEPAICLDSGKAFLPSDGVGQCCDECAAVEDIVPENCITSQCSSDNCEHQTANNCSINQALVPADGLCYCSDTCVYRPGKRNCKEEYCQGQDCFNANPNDCLSQGKAFVSKDGDCICCDYCANPDDVAGIGEPEYCLPDKCDTFECTNQTIADCNAREVLVPPHDCYCCNTCVARKPYYVQEEAGDYA